MVSCQSFLAHLVVPRILCPRHIYPAHLAAAPSAASCTRTSLHHSLGCCACLGRPPCCAWQPFPQAPYFRLPCSQSPTLPGTQVLNMHFLGPRGYIISHLVTNVSPIILQQAWPEPGCCWQAGQRVWLGSSLFVGQRHDPHAAGRVHQRRAHGPYPGRLLQGAPPQPLRRAQPVSQAASLDGQLLGR